MSDERPAGGIGGGAAPRVSIVIPAYRAAPFIHVALDAVARQTVQDYEIVVVDDASPDDTAAVIEAAGRADPRIRLGRLAQNGGPGAARNRALEMARGDWICLLDADDGMDPQRIERLLALAEAHGADLVSDNLLLQPADGGVARPMLSAKDFGPERRMGFAEFVDGNIFYPGKPARVSLGFMQPLISRAFLERHAIRYPPGVRSGEDFIFYLTCLAKGARWWITPEPGYHYHLRAGSMTDQQSQGDIGHIAAFEATLIAQAEADGDGELARVLRRHKRDLDRPYLYRRFTDALKARRWGEAYRWLRRQPDAPRLIAEHARGELPKIAAKALHGGYRRPAQTETAEER